MAKKKNKKAQFYLVASIVLVALFLSFISLMNYSIRSDNPEVYKYVDELRIEGAKVIDYEIYTGNLVFDDFAKNYSYYVPGQKDIYFIKGEQGSLDVFNYQGEQKNPVSYEIASGEVSIDIQGNDFSFELKEGENFYFVMKDQYKNQEYYITSIE